MVDARKLEFERDAPRDVPDPTDHVIGRAIKQGVDQTLTLKDGRLHVFSNDYTIIEGHGDYWCSCGETFGDGMEGLEAAEEHLKAAKKYNDI